MMLASIYNGEKGAESHHLDLDYLRRDPSAATRERGDIISRYSRGSLDNVSSRV